MTTAKTLCLNMIVKNEMANLERCLEAVAPYIACWVIGDTDSTDGTQDFIKSFFAKRDIPGELHSFPFVNFEQARNAALDCAYASPLVYDYLLLADADMELIVEDRDFRAKLEAPGYDLLQRFSISYWNPRIVRRDAGARYHGVTHEYLAVPGGSKQLRGVWYKDHASGSNRVDKFERDIRLLTEALKAEPKNDRYWFYLAQSYKDAGRTAEAAEAYAKRAEMGGWDEEVWRARLEEARCHRKLGDEGGFLRQALAAFNQRPQRAEPLYDLARFYRERGMNDVSVLFSEAGLGLKRPDADTLFIEDFVYQAGLKEEYSIAANYSRDPARKDRGFAACNWLALNREVPVGARNLARHNLRFYVEPADKMMPSFSARPIGFTPPDGYQASNPSVARFGEEIVLAQRCVNHTLMEGGQCQTLDGAPVNTRNFLLRLTSELDIQSAVEILPPADMPKPAFNLILGFEDLRVFDWRGQLWCCACVRELTLEGWCEQVLARIDDREPGACRLMDWRVLRPEGPKRHEKNWMPCVTGDALQFIYFCDPTSILDEQARTIFETVPAIAAENFRGGSQAIPFDGGWLVLIHEVLGGVSDKQRVYHHRFVWFDEASVLRGTSRPFFLRKIGIEFAAGLAWHPDGKRLLVSYGVGYGLGSGEAWIATIDAGEVRSVLADVKQLPSGTLLATGLPEIEATTRDGFGSQDPDKYRKDAQVLEQALQAEQDPFLRSRYTFYLARSYRDAGEKEKALDNYLKRAELGYWSEEIFESLFGAAQLLQAMGRPFDEVIAMYLRASDAAPSRAEALHAASVLCRESNKFADGFEYARRGLKIPAPTGGLFVQPWVYEYGLLDELAVNAYWIEQYQDSLEACQRLLNEGKMPQDMHDRVKKNAEFAAEKLRLRDIRSRRDTELIAAVTSAWVPEQPMAGTELMVAGLKERLGEELERINLQVNDPGNDKADKRPCVVWMHHDVDQVWVEWCKDRELVNSVSRFVFVSYWQRERYLNAFGLPPERCVVLRHALDLSAVQRRWEAGPIWRCAYTSTPFRGLSVLLDAWQRLSPANAELHVWSSMKLYRDDDAPFQHLYERAQSMPGVIYHGIAPNPELRAALQSMHFLVYPCTFAETACLSVIEAMAAGCRVIIPSLGALPETTGGYARIYPWNPDAEKHAAIFAENLATEMAAPWAGEPELSLRQQGHCAIVYDWPRRLREWRQLIRWTCDQTSRS
jgi:tetratricopeptide (TPR) repeat protein